ncbi:hypothetical protein [Streptomyces sp.]|uniref:hypothetical protein n=1 Tax=Streptomyces sp. TaxID=1931 RepID=UPI002F9392EE
MTNRSAHQRHLPTSPFKAPAAQAIKDFTLGDRVSHDRYGLGRIIGTELTGGAVLVDFGSSQTRIVSPYTGLHRL